MLFPLDGAYDLTYHLYTAGVTSLKVSMLQREREERLEGRMVFWGKVEGNENDYLVCYTLATPTLEEGDFPIKKVHKKHKFDFPCNTPMNAFPLYEKAA